MASVSPTHSWRDISPLDTVGINYEPMTRVPRTRVAEVIFIVAASFLDDEHALLYHCDIGGERRTFIKGMRPVMGLRNPEEERECTELRGKALTWARLIFLYYTPDGSRPPTYVLTNGGELYSMGDITSRISSPSSENYTPRFVKVDLGEVIEAVACGDSHGLLLTREKVFSFGFNNCGQAGSSYQMDVKQPEPIYSGTGNAAPCQVATGSCHSAIRTKDGKVYTFGSGDCGKLGHGSHDDVVTPTQVMALNDRHIQQVGCTTNAVYFLSHGELLACGLDAGRSGMTLLPTVVDIMSQPISSFRCSWSMVAVVTTSALAFCWEEESFSWEHKSVTDSHPRHVFSQGMWRDSGGMVYPVWTLQHTCRDAILQFIPRNLTDELPLHPNLIRFLKFGI